MNKKVMIVDDEIDILATLKTLLEKQNYEVVTVENGAECLKKIEEGFEGIVLMDIFMPQMNGWDTIKEIVDKGLIKNVAIEVVTGYGMDKKMMGMLDPYIYDYLDKPININELISSVENCNKYLLAKSNQKKENGKD